MKKYMKKQDFYIIAFVLIATGISFCFFFIGAKPGIYVEVSVNNHLEGRYSLEQPLDHIISQGGGSYNRLQIAEGVADVYDANCKDKLCVNQRSISKIGEMIICLPHKLVVQVVGDD